MAHRNIKGSVTTKVTGLNNVIRITPAPLPVLDTPQQTGSLALYDCTPYFMRVGRVAALSWDPVRGEVIEVAIDRLVPSDGTWARDFLQTLAGTATSMAWKPIRAGTYRLRSRVWINDVPGAWVNSNDMFLLDGERRRGWIIQAFIPPLGQPVPL